MDGQADILEDEVCSSFDESQSEAAQPLSQHSSRPIALPDRTAMGLNSKEGNTGSMARDTENTAADEQAIQQIVEIFHRRRWNFSNFLCVYMRSGERPARRVGIVQTAFKDPQVCKLAGLPQDNVVPNGADLLPMLEKEFKRLTGKPGFGAYDPTAPADALLRASTILKSIKEFAPIWYHILSNVLIPERSKQSGRKVKRTGRLQQKLLTITEIVCNTRRPRTVSYFHRSLGVYLMSSGVKKRVLEVLHGMGICASYLVSNEEYSKVAEAQKVCKTDQQFLIDMLR
jgi:hypothetical protein